MQVESPVMYAVSPRRKHEALEAVRRLRYGSPKLRDVIRLECRSRIKEKREKGFLEGRKLIVVEKNLKDVISEEIEKDIELQELVYAEMMSELDNLIEEEMKYITELERETVTCPICQKSTLYQMYPNLMACACGKYFDGRLEDLARDIKDAVERHVKCSNSLDFFSERPKSLNLMCYDCDFFFTIRP